MEILVSTTIGLIAFSLMLQSIKIGTTISSRISDQTTQSITLIKSYSVLSYTINQLDSHRLDIGVKLFGDGILRLADGTPHPLMASRTTSRPRLGSTIISSFGVAWDRRADVQKNSSPLTINTVRACYRSSPKSSSQSEAFRSYLLISVDSIAQATGTASAAGKGCYTLTYRLIPGVFSRLPRAPFDPITIFPIRDERSLFIDASSHLRLLGHVGSRITENQPIVRGLRLISATERRVTPHLPLFEFFIQTTGLMTRRWQHLVRLTRQELIDVSLS